MLQELRKTLARLEQPSRLEAVGARSLGVPAIDAALGGGLACGALHEIAATSEAHITAATGFTLGLSLGTRRKAIAWIVEDMVLVENGEPCGTGLDEFSLAPERLITVAVSHRRDLLWAMEEALHCRAVGTVIGEIRREEIDAVALRRISLAASEYGVLALMLRAAPSNAPSTAVTRWIVGAGRSHETHGPGPPRFDAHLVRNRRGPLGSWMLEWSDTDECFVLASTHPQPLVLPTLDRPARTVA